MVPDNDSLNVGILQPVSPSVYHLSPILLMDWAHWQENYHNPYFVSATSNL